MTICCEELPMQTASGHSARFSEDTLLQRRTGILLSHRWEHAPVSAL